MSRAVSARARLDELNARAERVNALSDREIAELCGHLAMRRLKGSGTR